MLIVKSKQQKAIESIERYAQVNNLQAGDKLPPIREIAKDFGLGYVTVAKAINVMARDGIVATQKKGGTRLLKTLSTSNRRSTYRLVLLSHVVNDRFSVEQESVLVMLRGLRQVLSQVDVLTLYHTNEDGIEGIKNILYYHYYGRQDQERIIFLLANCPYQVKKYFQDNNVPAIVMGGNEEGINLPNLNRNMNVVMSELMRMLEEKQAFPVAFLYDSELIGSQLDYYRQIKALHSSDGTRCGVVLHILDTPDIFRGQLQSLMSGADRPRTILVPRDRTALRVIRACDDLGIRIPEDVRIISIENSSISENMKPSLTGIYTDMISYGSHLGDMIKQISEGVNLSGQTKLVDPVFVYRESFPIN